MPLVKVSTRNLLRGASTMTDTTKVGKLHCEKCDETTHTTLGHVDGGTPAPATTNGHVDGGAPPQD
jgi:hypothetical protein